MIVRGLKAHLRVEWILIVPYCFGTIGPSFSVEVVVKLGVFFGLRFGGSKTDRRSRFGFTYPLV